MSVTQFCDPVVLNGIVRMLVKAAQDKRLVPYYEVENAFGLAHHTMAYYAGEVGHFCKEHDLPLLNSLLISSTFCRPSDGFDSYPENGKSWEACMIECFKTYHITTSREMQTRNFKGFNLLCREYVKNKAA